LPYHFAKVRTCGLHEKGENIAEDKYFGQPFGPNGSHTLPLRQQNQSTQDHVYACSEEGRGDEEKDDLHDIDSDALLVAVSNCSIDVSADFN
jgi:hypothetical protein